MLQFAIEVLAHLEIVDVCDLQIICLFMVIFHSSLRLLEAFEPLSVGFCRSPPAGDVASMKMGIAGAPKKGGTVGKCLKFLRENRQAEDGSSLAKSRALRLIFNATRLRYATQISKNFQASKVFF